MERGIFGFIRRYSARDQLALVLLSAAGLPFLYWTFDLPKTIVNRAIGGEGGFPKQILGHSLEQVPYLVVLCLAFLGLVLINGAFKYFTSTYRYRVGDRLLRRLRFDLIERLLRFPIADIRTMPSGQVVSMVTAETSSLGFFMAEAYAVPAVAIGTLGTIVLFMFLQDWTMGVAAIALYPLQIYLVPRIQRRINRLQREENLAVRGISDRIGELIATAPEIHGHDTSQYELARFTRRLGHLFALRVEMGSKRYTVNVLNGFFAQLTPFFFLLIGGYLVIIGKISLGSLVAVLAAYKDMYAPWKDLIDYYQKAEDGRVKYEQLSEYFAPPGLMDRAMLASDPPVALTANSLIVTNVVVEAEEGVKSIDGATVALSLPVHVAVVGEAGSGREEFARLLARQVLPLSGRIALGDSNLSELPDSVTGRRIGYAGAEVNLGSGSLRDVLTYPLLRRPTSSLTTLDETAHRDRREAEKAGNSSLDLDADWIDYDSAGCADRDALRLRIVEVLRLVNLEHEVYDLGLRRTIDPAARPELARRLVEARVLFGARVRSRGLTGLIETFDRAAYLSNASVAENILYGTPVGPTFAPEHLAENAYLLDVIERVGLTEDFLEKGRKLAAIMADIFRDLPPGHEFFDRFSFIKAEDLPAFDSILRRLDAGSFDHLADADRARLMALPFRLVAAHHNVGLIDDAFKAGILTARHAFARGLPPEHAGAVQFFDAAVYNAASSVSDNVLFGKMSGAQAGRAAQVTDLMSEVVAELDLRTDIVDLGLAFDIGVNAARLNIAQRQKLALGRCLLKRPSLLILNDALSALEPAAQTAVITRIRTEMAGRSIVLLDSDAARAATMERVLVMDKGKIVDQSAKTAVTGGNGEDGAAPHDVGLYELVAILMRIPLFSGIDRPRLKLLAFTSERLSYEAGQVVFRQGARGEKAYVVLEGTAEVVLESEHGTAPDMIVATIGSHQVFGEMALISAMPRTTTIRAKTALNLLAISHDVFVPLVEQNAAIAVGMTQILAARLASTLRDYGRAMAENGAGARR